MKKIAWFLALVMLVAAALPAAMAETEQAAETQADPAPQALIGRRLMARQWNPHHEFVDEDGDGRCDSCLLPKDGNPRPNFADENQDGVCDNCSRQPGEDGPQRPCPRGQQPGGRMNQRGRMGKGMQPGWGWHGCPGCMNQGPEGPSQEGPGQPQGPGRQRNRPQGPGRFRR